MLCVETALTVVEKAKREKRGDGCGGALCCALWVIVSTLGEMGSHQVWSRGAM